MKKHRERKLVPYTAAQVFDIVAGVERYPEFLPWCEALEVHRRWKEGGIEHLEATMMVATKIHSDAATTRVRLDRATHEVVVDLVDGPFKHLHNTWKMTDRAPRGCEVQFYIEFELNSRMFQMAVNAFFAEAARRMVRAFTERVKAVYG